MESKADELRELLEQKLFCFDCGSFMGDVEGDLEELVAEIERLFSDGND